MRGDLLYNIYGRHRGREDDAYFGAFRTSADAEKEVARLEAREMHGSNWAAQYHDLGFEIRTSVVDVDFELPPRPKPRDRYCVRATPVHAPGTWSQVDVEVFRRTDAQGGLEQVARYARNHGMYSTFEPFRQGNRDFALISRDYTATAVLDLVTGEVVAEEPPQSGGFCPVGFYVPDWWDIHNGSRLPGSKGWSSDDEWPDGSFGLVWGCVWGDDSAWKLQWLDLSRVREGVIRREKRFGYIELATRSWDSPCLSLAPPPAERSPSPPFIRMSRHQGRTTVGLDVETAFDADTGECRDWRRERISNIE
jgi:hypothetical protein